MAARAKPSGRSAGTSFIECTAMSARPSAIACSSSLTNRPLPPTSSRRRSISSSPRVLSGRSSTAIAAWTAARRDLMCSACHSARRLRRVAMVRCWMLTLLVGDQLAHRRPLPAAHRQALSDAIEDHLPVRFLLAAAGALEAADRGTRDEAVAVDTDERAGELALERDQRLLDQVL